MLGKVRGNLTASDRVDIRSDGSLTGDVIAARISIEDGAFFKGGIDIRKGGQPQQQQQQKAEWRRQGRYDQRQPRPSARALKLRRVRCLHYREVGILRDARFSFATMVKNVFRYEVSELVMSTRRCSFFVTDSHESLSTLSNDQNEKSP